MFITLINLPGPNSIKIKSSPKNCGCRSDLRSAGVACQNLHIGMKGKDIPSVLYTRYLRGLVRKLRQQSAHGGLIGLLSKF